MYELLILGGISVSNFNKWIENWTEKWTEKRTEKSNAIESPPWQLYMHLSSAAAPDVSAVAEPTSFPVEVRSIDFKVLAHYVIYYMTAFFKGIFNGWRLRDSNFCYRCRS